MNLLRTGSALLGLCLLFLLTACSLDDDNNAVDRSGTLIGLLEGDARFTTLVSALERVGLDATLAAGNSAFTLFAPTNQAFATAGIDLASVSDEALTGILAYHLVGFIVPSTTISEGTSFAPSLNTGSPGNNQVAIVLNRSGDNIALNNFVQVTDADNSASNGVLHVIDGVLTPPTVFDLLVNNPETNALAGALVSAQLSTDLVAGGPFTVFAPTDAAFSDNEDTVNSLSLEQLSKVLLTHVINGNVRSIDLITNDGVTLNEGQALDFTPAAGQATVTSVVDPSGDRVNFTFTDIQATNGVIHLLGDLLIPTNL